MAGSNELIHMVEQFILKFTALIVMDCLWKPEPQDEITIQFLLSSLCTFVLSCICLGVSGNVLVSSCAWFKMGEVH